MNSSGIDKLQTYLNRLEERTVENEMKIEGGQNKPVRFTKARVKERIRYYSGDQLIPDSSIIIIRGDQNWAHHVNYTLQKPSKALHFIMHRLKRGNNNAKLLAYMAIV